MKLSYLLTAIILCINCLQAGTILKPVWGKNEKHSKSSTIDGFYKKAYMGQGYDVLTQETKGRCVVSDKKNPSDSEVRVRYEGVQSAYMNLERSLTTDELYALLNVELDVGVSYGVFKLDAGAKFVSDIASSKHSQSLSYIYKVMGQSAILQDAIPSKRLEKIVENSTTSEVVNNIKEACGNEFIHTVDMGAMIIVNVKFEFVNEEMKTNFETQAKVSYAKLINVSGLIRNASKEFKDRMTVKISAVQIGGDPTRLANIMDSQLSNGSIAVLKCGIDNLEACEETLTGILNYITDPKEGFQSQIKDCTYDLDGNNPNMGCAPLKYHTKKYTDVGIKHELKPDALTKRTLESIRQDLFDNYKVYSRDNSQANKLNSMYLPEDKKKIVIEIQKKINYNMRLIHEAADICYKDDRNNCRESWDRFVERKKVYDVLALNYRLSFYDYCIGVNPSADPNNIIFLNAKSTSEIIKNYFQLITCEEADAAIKNAKDLIIRDSKITSLLPLKNLSKLENLDLSGNKISNLYNIKTMKNLKILKLRNNNIQNIYPIKELKNIHELDLVNNKIQDITAIRELTNLKSFKIYGNNIKNIKPVNNICHKDDALCFITIDDVCENERLWLLDTNIITRSQYYFRKELNLAPRYNRDGHRKSGIESWYVCSKNLVEFLDS